jgi:hypothetical protein
MDDHRASFGLGARDVVGAWLVCLAVVAVCLGSWGGIGSIRLDRAAAFGDPTAAADTAARVGRC